MRGQIICLQGNNKSIDGNFRSQKAKSAKICTVLSFLMIMNVRDEVFQKLIKEALATILTKKDRHDITGILLKVTLLAITLTLQAI
jgi:hypothetical protein